MIRTSLLLTLLASPAFSQNTDVQQRAVEAYVACVAIKGDLAMAAPNFALYGWTDREDTGAGTRFTKPDWAETTSALLSPDGLTCDVESTKVGTEAALAVLTDALRFTEFAGFVVTTDADGCTVLQLDATTTATLTAALTGSNDPAACASPTTSAILFTFAP